MTPPTIPVAGAPDEDLHCAVWTETKGFDPIGSATAFDRLVTVEIPQPWPATIEDAGWIADVSPPQGTRVQAVVPDTVRDDGDVLVTRWDRDGAGFRGTDWLVFVEEVPAVLATLVDGGTPDAPCADAPPEVLVCSHGSRDRCCGGPGTRLAVEARVALPDVRVRRTSHLGGHRFAPTALTLPEGRMWAFLDVDALAGVVDRTISPDRARPIYRGNVALDSWAQAVEADVLVERGWLGADFDTLDASVSANGDGATVRLRWSAGTLSDAVERRVEIGQEYPVLQCGLPPSEATKSARTYRVVDS